MTSSEATICENIRIRWERYDVGGRLYDTIPPRGKEEFINLVNRYKKEYADKGCGKDISMEKCLYQEKVIVNMLEKMTSQSQIGNLDYNQAMYPLIAEEKKKFEDLGCIKKIEQNRQEVVAKKINVYGGLDKERIEAFSKYQVKFRVFMGASILLTALTIIILKTKK